MGAKFQEWYQHTFDFVPNLLLIALIVATTLIISRRTQGLVQRLVGRTQAPPGVVDLLGRLARIGILALGLTLVLQQLGWSQAALSFLAGLGIVGIAIGFAIQDIVKQFAAGVLLLMLRPFSIGDNVKIGTFEGHVTQVQLRATVLKTANGDEVLIPNADVYTTAITNNSRYRLHRHDIPLTLTAEFDLERTRAAILDAMSEIPGVVADPTPTIAAIGFEGLAVKLEVRFWVDESANSADAVTTAVVAAIGKELAKPEDDRVRG